MESEEAILENENNSNLECESNHRQQQSQPSIETNSHASDTSQTQTLSQEQQQEFSSFAPLVEQKAESHENQDASGGSKIESDAESDSESASVSGTDNLVKTVERDDGNGELEECTQTAETEVSDQVCPLSNQGTETVDDELADQSFQSSPKKPEEDGGGSAVLSEDKNVSHDLVEGSDGERSDEPWTLGMSGKDSNSVTAEDVDNGEDVILKEYDQQEVTNEQDTEVDSNTISDEDRDSHSMKGVEETGDVEGKNECSRDEFEDGIEETGDVEGKNECSKDEFEDGVEETGDVEGKNECSRDEFEDEPPNLCSDVDFSSKQEGRSDSPGAHPREIETATESQVDNGIGNVDENTNVEDLVPDLEDQREPAILKDSDAKKPNETEGGSEMEVCEDEESTNVEDTCPDLEDQRGFVTLKSDAAEAKIENEIKVCQNDSTVVEDACPDLEDQRDSAISKDDINECSVIDAKSQDDDQGLSATSKGIGGEIDEVNDEFGLEVSQMEGDVSSITKDNDLLTDGVRETETGMDLDEREGNTTNEKDARVIDDMQQEDEVSLLDDEVQNDAKDNRNNMDESEVKGDAQRVCNTDDIGKEGLNHEIKAPSPINEAKCDESTVDGSNGHADVDANGRDSNEIVAGSDSLVVEPMEDCDEAPELLLGESVATKVSTLAWTKETAETSENSVGDTCQNGEEPPKLEEIQQESHSKVSISLDAMSAELFEGGSESNLSAKNEESMDVGTDSDLSSSNCKPVVVDLEADSEKQKSVGMGVSREQQPESDTLKETKSKTQSHGDDDDDDVIEIKEENADNSYGQEATKVSSIDISAGIKTEDGDIVILDDEDEVGDFVKKSNKDANQKHDVQNATSDLSDQKPKDSSGEAVSSDSPDKPGAEKSGKPGKSKTQTCIVCKKVCRCKYNIVRDGDTKQLCDDTCFRKFRKAPTRYLQSKKPPAATSNVSLVSILNKPVDVPVSLPQNDGNKNLSAPGMEPSQDQVGVKTCSVCQLMNINTMQQFCNWKGLDFCGEPCLAKFQATLNSSCSFCQAYIPVDMRASYCVKIGNDMRPFCKQKCYHEFRRKLRLCSHCHCDLNNVPSGSVISSGSKEYCSLACLKKMEDQEQNNVKIVSAQQDNFTPETVTCSVCNKTGTALKHSVRFQGKTFKLCSDLCLSAFQYTNKTYINKCDGCNTLCRVEEAYTHFIQFEGKTKRFCSDACVTLFRSTNFKIIPCAWCSTKKVNFDMIERVDKGGKFTLFCTLNCLSLYRVNLQAKSNQAVACDQCKKVTPAQYHLTMSDASVRNFCSYQCVLVFQARFSSKLQQPKPQNMNLPVLEDLQPVAQQTITPALAAPHPHGTRSRNRSKSGTSKNPKPSSPAPPSPSVLPKSSSKPPSASPIPDIPIISSVVSLAPQTQTDKDDIRSAVVGAMMKKIQSTGNLLSGDGKQQVVVEAPPNIPMRNKSTQCRPVSQTKATSCRPHSQTKETQTDPIPAKPMLVPVPVPIYIPMPCVMSAVPVPTPLPIPIPIPVPLFIPTTRKSANGIIKAIKEISERMPSDPLEAEMLLMAEAVAADVKTGDSDTESEHDGAGNDFAEEPAQPEKETDSLVMKKREGAGEEDMIQMALRMAEEMSGPIEDLESSVQPMAVNSAEAPASSMDQIPTYERQVQDDGEYVPPKSGRGRGKRNSRGRPPATSSRSKRARTERSYTEEETDEPPEPSPAMEPPPDANYRLKFTYGVNAWRHWVVNKNSQMEKENIGKPWSHKKMRPLPPDILKCTMDELNYAMCMFIKEVRKPNGAEYSPDSIYYLCLGIQQYLYENGRIDNIFTDLYFQRFTDALHEVIKTLQPKVNSQGQMLCRIEEEHLWESKQLGAHSPYILLNTLIYFHTKHFVLKTAEEHMSLSFAQIVKHVKKGAPSRVGGGASRNVAHRFYCLAGKKDASIASKKSKDGVPVYEVTENFENPLRCPVKLYEFFLSKCPESIKNRNDIFYPIPERSCVPDSPVWYSTVSIDLHTMAKMLTRILLLREIQEAHLQAQPIYL